MYLRPDTRMPMIYIDDCLRGTLELLECPAEKLKRRTYNMQGVSFTPDELTAEVKKFVPHLEVEYEVDPLRQSIGKTASKLMSLNKNDTVCFSTPKGILLETAQLMRKIFAHC